MKSLFVIGLAFAASCFVSPGYAESKPDSCFANGENEHATLRGTIVQSITLEKNDGTGEPAHHKFMAIALDKPICFLTDPQKSDPSESDWESLVKAFPMSRHAGGKLSKTNAGFPPSPIRRKAGSDHG